MITAAATPFTSATDTALIHQPTDQQVYLLIALHSHWQQKYYFHSSIYLFIYIYILHLACIVTIIRSPGWLPIYSLSLCTTTPRFLFANPNHNDKIHFPPEDMSSDWPAIYSLTVYVTTPCFLSTNSDRNDKIHLTPENMSFGWIPNWSLIICTMTPRFLFISHNHID